jgi:hypothetical protein
MDHQLPGPSDHNRRFAADLTAQVRAATRRPASRNCAARYLQRARHFWQSPLCGCHQGTAAFDLAPVRLTQVKDSSHPRMPTVPGRSVRGSGHETGRAAEASHGREYPRSG